MSEQIDTALRWGRSQMESCSESPRLDAELLLAHCLNKPRSYLYGWPEETLPDSCWRQFQQLVAKRLEPTPVAYLLGKREFYSMEFCTAPGTLVPRPETELLVEQALLRIPQNDDFRILDLGTGTGIVAITLKHERQSARIWATDVDPGCLALARQNAIAHGAEIEFIESDWFQNIPEGSEFDLIVSNPPYVAADHPFLAMGDLPAEPVLALSPGETGLEALRRIIDGAADFLVDGGELLLEHGYDQQTPVRQVLESRGFSAIQCWLDHNQLPRTTGAKLIEKNPR